MGNKYLTEYQAAEFARLVVADANLSSMLPWESGMAAMVRLRLALALVIGGGHNQSIAFQVNR